MSASHSHFTSIADIDKVYAAINQSWKSGVTRPVAYRRRQLLQFARMLQDNLTALEDAVWSDLRKQRVETISTEVTPLIQGALHAAENVEEWAKPDQPKVEEWRSNWNATIYPVPKGIALIISPWNFPIILTLMPLIGAIAAGCPTVVKPSEYSPATSSLLADLFARYLDPAACTVVLGGVPETTHLLESRWGHIFYTGSGRVGRIIAAAAAKYVTPISLELGGKSPVIIAPDCDLDLAAKRMLFGKVQNCGQLCVTPDYVLVPRSIATAFKASLLKAHASFFPTDPLAPDSPWGKIVNAAQFKRLQKLIKSTKGRILTGGTSDESTHRIALTIVDDIKLDDPLMEEELFGPILPIIEVEDIDEAIQIISDRPSPLVVYVFSKSEDLKQPLLDRTTSGSLIFNDTFYQIAVYEIPFGGHGESGFGGYFGKHSFEIFTHRRSHVNVPAEVEPFYAHRYLPYTEEGYKALSAAALVKIPDA